MTTPDHLTPSPRAEQGPGAPGTMPAAPAASSFVRVLGLLILALSFALVSLPLGTGLLQRPGSGTAVALLWSSQAAAGLALVSRRPSRVAAWLLLLPTWLALAAVLHQLGADLPRDFAPGYCLLGLAALGMTCMRRVEYYAFGAVSTLGLWILMVLITGRDDWFFLTVLVWAGTPVFQTLLFGDAVMRVARARALWLQRDRAARVAVAQAVAADQRERETTRVLHDHVLHALHGLARSAETARVPHLVEDCRRAATAVRRSLQQAPQVLAQQDVPDDGARAGGWHLAPSADTRKVLINTVFPGLFTALVTAALAGPHMGSPRLLLPVAVAVVVLGVVTAHRLERGPLGPRATAALLTLAWAAWIANLVAAPTGSRDPYEYWVSWAAAPIVHLVVLSTPLRQGALLASAWSLAQVFTLALQVDDPSQLLPLSSVVSTGAGECLVTVLVLGVVHQRSWEAVQAARRAAALNARASALERAWGMDREWSQVVTLEALPLLESVATGRLLPEDPDVRRRAQVMETSLREELVLGHTQQDLLEALQSAREQGWAVSSTLGGDDPAPSLVLAGELLRLVGPPHHPGQHLTVSAGQHRATLLVLGATSAAQHARWREALAGRAGAGLHVDQEFARLSVDRG